MGKFLAEYLRSGDFQYRHAPIGLGVLGAGAAIFGPTKIVRALGLVLGACGFAMYKPPLGTNGPRINFQETKEKFSPSGENLTEPIEV